LLLPTNQRDLTPSQAESVALDWSESIDPDSGQAVDYSLHIQVAQAGSPTVVLVYPGLTATDYSLDLLSESGFNPPTSSLTVHWWVTANSAGDTVHSLETFGFVVTIPQGVIVSTPNGGEHWYIGDQRDIVWTSFAIDGPVRIELGHGSGHGQTWDVIVSSTTNDGSYTWTVTGPTMTDARIRVSSVSSPTVGDESDGVFEISASGSHQTREIGTRVLALDSPYPNPFNAMTELRFSVPTAGPVELQVYGLLGNLVATPVRGRYEPGNYRVSFDAAALPTGTYFCRLRTGEGTRIQKMLLAR